MQVSVKKDQIEKRNSIILVGYMLLCFGAEMAATQSFHNFLKIGVIIVSFIPMLIIKKRPIVLFCFFVFLFVFILDIINEQLSSVTLFVLSAPLFASFVRNSRFNITLLIISFLIISLILLNAVLRGHAQEILVNSANFVSVTILFNAVLLTYIVYNQSSKIILFPSLMAWLVCLFAVGRSGILCSSFLFAGILFLKFNRLFTKRIRILVVSLISVLVISSIPVIVDFYESADNLERLRTRGFNDYSRERILEAYMSHIDLYTFIIGYNISKDPTIHSFGDNPHNSYIKLHSHMGVFFLVPLVLVGWSIVSFIRNRQFLYLLLLLSLLIRCYTDMILLNHYDFVIMVFAFSAIANNRINNTNMNFQLVANI